MIASVTLMFQHLALKATSKHPYESMTYRKIVTVNRAKARFEVQLSWLERPTVNLLFLSNIA